MNNMNLKEYTNLPPSRATIFLSISIFLKSPNFNAIDVERIVFDERTVLKRS